MSITLSEAERSVHAAQKKAIEMGCRMTIAIVDSRGDLVILERMDGSPWRSVMLAQGKAIASAAYGLSSSELEERADRPVMQALMQSHGGLFVPQQGALPITKNGTLLGAIGVSGASSQEDEVVASAGLVAIGIHTQ